MPDAASAVPGEGVERAPPVAEEANVAPNEREINPSSRRAAKGESAANPELLDFVVVRGST